MTPNEYQQACLRTISPIAASSGDDLLLQGVMGMNGEAGEAIDIVKKVRFHGHPFDDQTKEHLAKELGDVLWYISTSATAIGYDLEDVMKMNINKLQHRYKDGFSTEESLHRKKGDI